MNRISLYTISRLTPTKIILISRPHWGWPSIAQFIVYKHPIDQEGSSKKCFEYNHDVYITWLYTNCCQNSKGKKQSAVTVIDETIIKVSVLKIIAQSQLVSVLTSFKFLVLEESRPNISQFSGLETSWLRLLYFLESCIFTFTY